MNMIKIQSPAKINLFLKILGKRDDGYHNIETSFQLIDLYDSITFKEAKNSIIIKSNKFVSEKSDNIIFQSAKFLSQYTKKNEKKGVIINLQKNIPIGAGLGGGSSNAATTLIALNKLWDLNLSKKQLFKIGIKLGADVNFFINGKNSLAKGIGEKLKEIPSIDEKILIIYPSIHNSTKKMFTDLERFKGKNSLLSNQNHFWDIFLNQSSEVKDFVEENSKNNEINLSGSGSCMFVFYKDDKDISKIIKKIPPKWRLFFCKPLQYSPICYI